MGSGTGLRSKSILSLNTQKIHSITEFVSSIFLFHEHNVPQRYILLVVMFGILYSLIEFRFEIILNNIENIYVIIHHLITREWRLSLQETFNTCIFVIIIKRSQGQTYVGRTLVEMNVIELLGIIEKAMRIRGCRHINRDSWNSMTACHKYTQ